MKDDWGPCSFALITSDEPEDCMVIDPAQTEDAEYLLKKVSVHMMQSNIHFLWPIQTTNNRGTKYVGYL